MVGELTSKVYEFGTYRLDPTRRLLLRADGRPVTLTPKAFEVLHALVASNGDLLNKDELMGRVWRDSFVEEANLTQTISVLRRALGESRGEHRYILTEPGRGYRFVAPVKTVDQPHAANSTPPPAESLNAADSVGESPVGEKAFEKPIGTAGRRPAWLFLRTRSFIAAVSALLFLTVAGGLLFLFEGSSKAPANAREIRSIAVLPFRTIGADEENRYVGSGMTETLIIKLSKIKRIVVRQSGSVSRYAESESDPAVIGKELRVDALLTGSVQRDGERVRVSVRLVRVDDGLPLWAETFDDQFRNLFAVQDSISEKVAQALTLELTGEEQIAVKKRYTNNLEAEQLYHKGRFFWNKRTLPGFERAIENFNQAIRLDPNFALAYAGLADTYVLVNLYSPTQDPRAFPNARQAAERALQLDEQLAEAHAALGLVRFQYEFDWSGAEQSYRRAIELNPHYATARQWYGEFLSFQKRTDEAVVQLEKAVELDPASPSTNNALALPYLLSHQSEKALEITGRVLEMDPDFSMALTYQGRALTQLKKYNEAIEVLQKAIRVTRGSAFNTASLGNTFAVAGRDAEARKLLADLHERAKTGYVAPYNFAIIYTGLGERETALNYLEKAFTERDLLLSILLADSRLESLRGDARFRQLLGKLKLRP